jgi:DNA-binding response OmpR family regulator
MGSRVARKGRSPRQWDLDEARVTPRVLLAEDDVRTRLSLSSLLRRDGFDVIEAKDGAELLERLASTPATSGDIVDLVIADLHGPPANGMDLLGLVRDVDWATPVILFVDVGDPVLDQDPEHLGTTIVFARPFDVEQVRSTVAYWT